MKNLMLASSSLVAVIFLVSCGGGGSSTSSSTPPVVPTATNTAPVIAAANSNQTGQEGQNFTYDATQSGSIFSDADGDTLSYAVTYSPSALGLTDRAGIISGIPSQAGTVTVTITADDGNGGQASDTFDIVISAAAVTSTKPNIIFLISDDQGKDSSAQYALTTDVPSTPNLTALADNGVIFDNAWVSPTCSPTRAALMTGKQGGRTNVLTPGDALPTSETILQSFLKSETTTSDYASAVIGKWHLGGGQTGPNDFGIDYFAGIINGSISDYFSWNLNINGTSTTTTNYATTELTDLAVDWVDDQTTPWFLWLSYNAPHTPFHLPPTGLHNRNLTGTEADITANSRDYYLASIEAMDTEFGRLWNSMDVQEQANTIVIYLGDNGTPRQAMTTTALQSGNKGDLEQGGINTPLFISGAGITRTGERENALVTHTDFFATIAELAGAELAIHNDGQSFADLLTNPSAPERDYAFTEHAGGWAIRNARYKLIETTAGAQDLYDLETDPAEQSDLLDGTTDVSVILAELTTEAASIRGATNITNASFSKTSPLCSDYVGQYTASATDVANNTEFQATLEISASNTACTFTSNSLPNHNFNDGPNAFPNTVGAVTETFTFPATPVPAQSTTALNLNVDNAILLNGVKVDVLAAACFGVGNEKTGCGDINQPWRFDPMHGPNGFNVDNNNAHAQPDGAYHYHGPPPITTGDASTVSGVIGFAADGFPIYGSYFDNAGTITMAQSSYRLKTGSRPTGAGDPGGTYDGSFRDDYEYVNGLGTLDACNGMTIDGQYGYRITPTYPYVIGCFNGTPDPSFNK